MPGKHCAAELYYQSLLLVPLSPLLVSLWMPPVSILSSVVTWLCPARGHDKTMVLLALRLTPSVQYPALHFLKLKVLLLCANIFMSLHGLWNTSSHTKESFYYVFSVRCWQSCIPPGDSKIQQFFCFSWLLKSLATGLFFHFQSQHHSIF